MVHSIVLATLPPEESNISVRQMANRLGLPNSTYQNLVKVTRPLQRQLMDPTAEIGTTIFSQVVKSNGWRKIDPALKAEIHAFIRGHEKVSVSPNKDDLVMVRDADDLSKKIRVMKMLLRCSVCELHNNLIRHVKACTDAQGHVRLSDTKLR